MKSTPKFRCKCHEPIFQSFYNSYVKDNYTSKMVNYGGRASGKSHAIADNVVFWLPEEQGAIAVIIVYSAQHKATTSLLFQKKLIDHGYQINQVQQFTGDIIYRFANNNYIIIKSMETSSIDQLGEKFKNFEIPADCFLKVLAFEEFIACLNVFRGDLRKFENVLSSFNRHFCKNNLTFYTLNPPENKTHIFFKWLRLNNHLKKHFTTIYDLPQRYQSVEDLQNAERLKVNDNETFRHIYLGECVGSNGLAFDVTNIYIDLDNLQFIKYYVQTDESTTTATTFSLFGLTTNGILVLIDNWYHSASQSGQTKAPSEYANDFYNWLNESQVGFDVEICTDGVVFATELLNYGFVNVESIGGLKNRKLSFQLAKKIVDEGLFKIGNNPNNSTFYLQMENAEKEITNDGTVVSKKFEKTKLEEKHTHTVDTLLYLCLRLQRLILGVDDE